MEKLSVKDLDVAGKRALIRVDFNVPLDKAGNITDDTRIRASLPTIQWVLEQGGSVVLMSHLGRPKGERKPEFSLRPCAIRLQELLGTPVAFAPDCIGESTLKKAKDLKPKEILLLENLRFYKAEEKPETDPSFAKQLSELGDIYINDAFGTAHRAHSSTATIAKYFPKKAAAGFLLQKEIDFLGKALLENPKRPFFALIGGSKISSKMGVLKALSSKVDALFIGGGMAYTFFKAQGQSIGNSLHEDDLLEEAKAFLAHCKAHNIELYLPQDIVLADAFNENAHTKIVSAQEGIPDGWQGMDIGPATLKAWAAPLAKAKTVFWNGPVGVFEMPPFAKGTNALATLLASLHATTVIGGGDSVAAINKLGMENRFSHLSTGGGASLELIEFGHLPGIDALTNK